MGLRDGSPPPVRGPLTAHDPERIVREGWNRASWRYRPEASATDAFDHADGEYRRWLQPLLDDLPDGSAVLDLGCGCGIPAARILSRRFRVTGVDLSEVQVERARALVPGATFLRESMTEVEFPEASFRGVVCLYALIHVPLPAERPLLDRMHRWLADSGWLVIVTGHDALEGVEENWLGSGAPMYWSHSDAATYRGWIEEAGFTVVSQQFIPEGSSGHELFIARSVRASSRPACSMDVA